MQSTKSNVLKFLRNSRGQAVLEYVLLIFIILLIVLPIIASIANSTKKFSENYYGAYFECLLEVGELPQLGADGNSETECDDLHEPFTVADGRPLKFDLGNSPGYGDSGNGEAGSGNDSDSGRDDSSQGESGSGESESSTASSSGSYDGSSPRGQSSVFAEMGGRKKTVPLSNADKNKEDSGDGLNGMASGTNNFELANDESGRSGRTKYVPIYGTTDQEGEENKDNAKVKAQVEANPEQELRGKRVPVSVKNSADVELEESEEFSLGHFIKILIIAAIILIILVFFGGQVMQYSKSQE